MNDKRMIGHYQVVEQLGAGAMGAVHVAVDTFIDRTVAIKSLRPELSQDPEFVSRFRAEAKSLARLNHPNIATLYAPMFEGDQLYMVMELVRGKPLDEILEARGRPLGVKESLAIMAQAADGLSYAHEMGVIHRDIKPSNLMISDDGRVKIMDFGIARVRGSVRLTRTGTAVGTPLYMSPEQCRGAEGDERSDIYSLGIVLYEMLSGAPPFSGSTEYELIQAQISAVPAPLVPRSLGVTSTLEAAVMKAIAKKPDDRFQTMRAFSDAVGATVMRPDATGLIRSAEHLISTSQTDAATQKAGVADLAKSRAMAMSRGIKASGAAKLAAAVVALAALGGGAAIFLRAPDTQTPESSVSAAGRPVVAVASAPAAAPAPVAAPAPRPVVAEPPHKPAEAATPPVAPETPPGASPAPAIADLRMALKGTTTERIRAADFDYISDNVKTQSLELAMRLAAAGSAEAQFALGMLLLETPGKQNVDRAFTAFSDAARQSYPDAQANLAGMYHNGAVGGQPDFDKAYYWYRLAAESGNTKSQFWLGCYYLNGWGGLARDRDKASEQFTRAQSGGYALAATALSALAPGSRVSSPCGARK